MQTAAPRTLRARGQFRAVLRRPGFRRLLSVRLISQFGDGCFQAGLAGSVLFNPDQAPNPVAFATAFAILLLPYSVLGPFVGVFLDRWSRARTLVVVNAVRAVLVVGVALLIRVGSTGPLFVVGALAIIALNRFFLAGTAAAQPHVVGDDGLVTANALVATAGTIIYAVGIGASGLVINMLSSGAFSNALVAITAVAWYGVAAGLARVSFGDRDLGPTQPVAESVWAGVTRTVRGLAAGLRHLAGRPGAARMLVVYAALRGLYGFLVLLGLLLYRNYYNDVADPTSAVAGLLPVAAGTALGSFAAGVVTPRVSRRFGGARWVAALLLASAVLIPVTGLPFIASLTVAMAFVANFTTQAGKVVNDTVLQAEIDDDFRGRVFSVNDTSFNLTYLGGIVVGAVVLPMDGHLVAAPLVVGACYAVLGAWFWAVNR